MTGPSGNQLILFEPRETLRFLGNKVNCFPWDQLLSVKYYMVKSASGQVVHTAKAYQGFYSNKD